MKMLLENFAVLTPAFLFLSLTPVKAQTTSPFPDVPANHWAYSATVALYQKGILVGYPKEYDNSTPEACWKSLIKAMERRDKKTIRELVSDEAWKTLIDGQGNEEMHLEYLRRLAHKIRRREQERLTEWLPVEQSEKGDIVSVIVRLCYGTSDALFSFHTEKSGWRVNSIHAIY